MLEMSPAALDAQVVLSVSAYKSTATPPPSSPCVTGSSTQSQKIQT